MGTLTALVRTGLRPSDELGGAGEGHQGRLGDGQNLSTRRKHLDRRKHRGGDRPAGTAFCPLPRRPTETTDFVSPGNDDAAGNQSGRCFLGSEWTQFVCRDGRRGVEGHARHPWRDEEDSRSASLELPRLPAGIKPGRRPSVHTKPQSLRAGRAEYKGEPSDLPYSLPNASDSPEPTRLRKRRATCHHATTRYPGQQYGRGRTNGQQLESRAEDAAGRLTSRLSNRRPEV